MNSIIIAAPQSGCGKTTITLGIMECLKRRGLKVAPFKVGPDFIDPGYHRLVTGRPSINLDGWMCSADFVRSTFERHYASADVAVIEGVMGLFDGISGLTDEGSTAQVAKICAAPVVLVVDAKSQARSAAALVKGFAEFDPQLRLAGVIFNNVGSANHERLLREALEASLPAVKLIGCVPRDEKLHLPSRHLGLVTAEENPLPSEFLDNLAGVIEQHVDLDGILNVGATSCGCLSPGQLQEVAPTIDPVPIAVACDKAFSFVYEDNLRLLRQAGAELVEFSPLADERLPERIAGIYLPGGYPELFGDALAANGTMKGAIGAAIEAGMPVYAECGGFIYLTKGVGTAPFVGIFPVKTKMLPRRKALGYRQVELTTDSIIGPSGMIARGHEFHYSEMEEMPSFVERLFLVSKGNLDLGQEGYRYKNCLASYIHLHFGSCPELADAFVASCRKFKGE